MYSCLICGVFSVFLERGKTLMRRYGLSEGHVSGTAADNRLFVEVVLYRCRAVVSWRKQLVRLARVKQTGGFRLISDFSESEAPSRKRTPDQELPSKRLMRSMCSGGTVTPNTGKLSSSGTKCSNVRNLPCLALDTTCAYPCRRLGLRRSWQCCH